MVTEACILGLPNDPKDFDPDYIRVAKILGGAITDSRVIHGLVIARNVEGSVTSVKNPKVACYS